MTTARCHACGAAVAVGAPWCTLCFADLRPDPAPEPVSVGASGGSAAAAAVESGVHELPPHPILDGPLPPVADVDRTALDGTELDGTELDRPVGQASDITLAPPAWPCHRCGELVALDLTECPICGAAFLEPARNDTVIRLPIVGDLAQVSSAYRLGVMVGGMLALAVALFLVYLVLGALL